MFDLRITFVASERPEAQEALRELTEQYGQCTESDAEVIVALGGDGCMLEALRGRFQDQKPVYGMKLGRVGFLMNPFSAQELPERINNAASVTVRPLKMEAKSNDDQEFNGLAINEVSLLRQTAQTAILRISVDDKERIADLMCDGALVATPAGSTAYNYSAHGPILPIGSNLLALTPISAFRPRRWRGALLRHTAKVHIETLEADKRPICAFADNQEYRNIQSITIEEDRARKLTLLFDPEQALDERILQEQFSV